MTLESPPPPDARVALEIKGLPVRLYWKLMETARKQDVSLDYLIFKLLVDAVGYDAKGESYDLVVKEIQSYLGEPSVGIE